MSTNDKTPLPIFIKADKIPGDVTTYEICAAAEEIAGPLTIDGAICISGLWRISPLYEASRIKILANGIQIRGCTVGVESVNPFTMKGDESAGTKLYIGNLPFSYSSEAVKKHLQAAGLTLRSEIVWEKARAPDGSLSDWKTGRRMVWVNVPLKPLNRFMRMGNGFSAVLYYKEMRESRKCNKCLQYGHIAKYCEREEVCFTCKKTGHRKGDPKCDLGSQEIEITDNQSHEESKEDDQHKISDTNVDDSQAFNKKYDEVNVEGDESGEETADNSDASHSEWETSEELEVDTQSNDNELPTQKPPLGRSEGTNKKNEQSKSYGEKETPNHQKVSNLNISGGNPPKKKAKKKKGDKGSSNSVNLKQCTIDEYTPGGKRDGSEVFSPDTPTSTHGPVGKKPNTQNENKI